MMDQAAQIKHLQGQIEMMQGAYGGQLHAAQTKVRQAGMSMAHGPWPHGRRAAISCRATHKEHNA